jgi:hypothetical protein
MDGIRLGWRELNFKIDEENDLRVHGNGTKHVAAIALD